MDSLVVLVHSPVVGPFTWSMVAEQLRQRKVDVLVPKLADRDDNDLPYWDQHTAAVKQALADVPPGRPVVLVGHSGAGPLLPAIHRAIAQPVAACLFVDASLPHPGQSRFDELASCQCSRPCPRTPPHLDRRWIVSYLERGGTP
jgi:predicted alpha/beta hydrolase family esterase